MVEELLWYSTSEFDGNCLLEFQGKATQREMLQLRMHYKIAQDWDTVHGEVPVFGSALWGHLRAYIERFSLLGTAAGCGSWEPEKLFTTGISHGKSQRFRRLEWSPPKPERKFLSSLLHPLVTKSEVVLVALLSQRSWWKRIWRWETANWWYKA